MLPDRHATGKPAPLKWLVMGVPSAGPGLRGGYSARRSVPCRAVGGNVDTTAHDARNLPFLPSMCQGQLVGI